MVVFVINCLITIGFVGWFKFLEVNQDQKRLKADLSKVKKELNLFKAERLKKQSDDWELPFNFSRQDQSSLFCGYDRNLSDTQPELILIKGSNKTIIKRPGQSDGR